MEETGEERGVAWGVAKNGKVAERRIKGKKRTDRNNACYII